jgi:ketosteroid isomerase-like protein
MSSAGTASSEQRLERLDATAQIRQLAVRYAAAMRVRDGEALARLYVDDVRVGGGAVAERGAVVAVGREALRDAYFGAALERLSISVLHPGTHVVELDRERPDRARGSVYTVAQIRDGDRWMRQAICYFDRYAKRDGEWLFVTRDHQLFYGTDYDQRPNHLPPANWPDSDTGTGTLPYAWESWQAYESSGAGLGGGDDGPPA